MIRDEAITKEDGNRSDGRIFVRVVSQVSFNVLGSEIFREIQERVMKWAFDPDRNVRGIPDSAWEGNSFEIDAENSERLAAISIDEPKYWGMRFSERLKDPGRIWTTEVGVAEIGSDEVVFGCRLLCAEIGSPVQMPRSIPRFVRGIVFTKSTKLDGRDIGPDPWIINTEREAESLADFLQQPSRKHPVVVFSLPEGSSNPNETIFPVKTFIRRTAGFIHTAVITSNASYFLTDLLGKEFSVYRQAVRSYLPGLSTNTDLSSDHPVATAARISSWQSSEDSSFEDFLVHQTLRVSRPRQELEKEHPPFHQIKRLIAEKKRKLATKQGLGTTEELARADEAIEAAKVEVDEYLALHAEAEKERDDARSEAREIRSQYVALQARLQAVLAQPAESKQPIKPLPDNLFELSEWAKAELSGFVEVHERALKVAQKSNFENPQLIFDTLLLLRDVYVPMRVTGGKELVDTFDQKLAQLGLENTKCFGQKNKAKSFGGEYFVKYQGAQRELDWHLKGSSSRKGQRGFRLYYFWDPETQRVVVGHFPGHLKTDAS